MVMNEQFRCWMIWHAFDKWYGIFHKAYMQCAPVPFGGASRGVGVVREYVPLICCGTGVSTGNRTQLLSQEIRFSCRECKAGIYISHIYKYYTILPSQKDFHAEGITINWRFRSSILIEKNTHDRNEHRSHKKNNATFDTESCSGISM